MGSLRMRCEIGVLKGKLHRHNIKAVMLLHRLPRQGQDLCSQVRPKIRLHRQEMTMMSSWALRLLRQTRGTLIC